MKIIYVTPFFRVPPDFGIGIRNYQIINYLCQRHEVIFITFGEDETCQTNGWLREHCSAFYRLPITSKVSDRTVDPGIFARLAQFPPLSYKHIDKALLARTIRGILDSNPDTDLLYLDTQFAGQVLIGDQFDLPSVISLADIQADYWLKKLRVAGLRPYSLIYLSDLIKTAYYERLILKNFQHIITVSVKEYSIVRRWFHHANVILAPNGVDVDYFKSQKDETISSDLLFVAGYEYEPNVDAFFYFCKEIFPMINVFRPGITFTAVGRRPTAAMKALAKVTPGISVTGRVPDVRPYYNSATAAVVPLRFGSGTKLKILEAFAMSTPVITTSVGLEGLKAVPSEHFFLADDPKDFAYKTARLLNHPGEQQLLAQRARNYVTEHYAWEKILTRLEQDLLRIAKGLTN